MIELFYAPTPNGWKISIALEEMGLDYGVTPVNILRGAQFTPEFLAISPNNRIPAMLDHAPDGGGEPIAVFESGAILIYLAEKTGRFLPRDPRGRFAVLQWLMWQMANLGPMAGQAHHFLTYAPEQLPYAIKRYLDETGRLYGVLDRQLQGRDYVAGDYSIADMAIWPWVHLHQMHRQNLEEFPQVGRWHEQVGGRAAVQRGVAVCNDMFSSQGIDEEGRKVLFGQQRRTGC